MRNIIAATSLAFLTAACGQETNMCIVTRDGNDYVRRAEIVSPDGKNMLHYATSFTETADDVWEGGLYNAGQRTSEYPSALIIVDKREGYMRCDVLTSNRTNSIPIVDPAFRNN